MLVATGPDDRVGAVLLGVGDVLLGVGDVLLGVGDVLLGAPLLGAVLGAVFSLGAVFLLVTGLLLVLLVTVASATAGRFVVVVTRTLTEVSVVAPFAPPHAPNEPRISTPAVIVANERERRHQPETTR